MSIEMKLVEFGIILFDVLVLVVNYVFYVILGNMLFVLGQILVQKGKLGVDLVVEVGVEVVCGCGLVLLVQVQKVLGLLDWVKQVVKLGGFVNLIFEFIDQFEVINGCLNLMVEVFGDCGCYVCVVVFVFVLLCGVVVEVEVIFEIV